MYYTQTSKICCWVEISIVTELCLLGKRSVVLGSIHVSRHAQRRNEEVKFWPSVAGVQQSFGEQTGPGGGRGISIYQKDYTGLTLCVVHGGLRAVVSSFFLSLLLSHQAWPFNLCLIFSEVFLWNWIWKTQLA